MQKFNRHFTTATKVQLPGEYGFRNIREIHPSRNRVKIVGIEGSFQRCDIVTFTNRPDAEMYPAIRDIFVTDQYDSVYRCGTNENVFVGKLCGRKLKTFVAQLQTLQSAQPTIKNTGWFA